MVEIDGQTIYLKRLVMKNHLYFMIHGFGGSSDGFQKIYSDLAKNHTIISVDALGFGLSLNSYADGFLLFFSTSVKFVL